MAAEPRIPSVSSDGAAERLLHDEDEEELSTSSPSYNEHNVDKSQQMLVELASYHDNILSLKDRLKSETLNVFQLFSSTYDEGKEMQPMLTNDLTATILNEYGLTSFKSAKYKYVIDYMNKRSVQKPAAAAQWKKHFIFLMACLSIRRTHEQRPTFAQFEYELDYFTTNYEGKSPSHGKANDRIVDRSLAEKDGSSRASSSEISSLTSQSGRLGKNERNELVKELERERELRLQAEAHARELEELRRTLEKSSVSLEDKASVSL